MRDYAYDGNGNRTQTSPVSGRWTAKDPIRFGSIGGNLYGYVFNDSINANDPTGKILPVVFGFAAAGKGLVLADGAIVAASGLPALVAAAVNEFLANDEERDRRLVEIALQCGFLRSSLPGSVSLAWAVSPQAQRWPIPAWSRI